MPNQVLEISTSSILRVFVVLLGIAFVFSVWQIIASVFLAVVIASGVEPAVNALSKAKIPRLLAAIIIYVAGFLILASVFSTVLPVLISETRQLSVEFPSIYDDFVGGVENFLGLSAEDETTKKQIEKILAGAQKTLSENASNIFTFTFNIFGGILSFMLVVVISFYLVIQKDGIENFLKSIIPGGHHEYALNLWHRVEKRLGRWFQYQMLMGVSVGFIFFIALWLMGVEYALTLALVAGVFEVIPMIWPIIVGMISFTLTSFQSFMLALGVVAVYILIEQIQQQFLMPSIMSKAIGLNPIIIIVTLLVAANLIGFWGIVLAIPFAVVLSEFAKDFKR